MSLLARSAPNSFIPSTCPNATFFGPNCDRSATICSTLQPCQNNGTCANNVTSPHGYHCVCSYGFIGTQCQIDQRPCQLDTCRGDGKSSLTNAPPSVNISFFLLPLATCKETSSSTFRCLCSPGWQGVRCETMIDLCANITCLNKGVCRPSLLNYTCECLGESYSGRHCEIKSASIATRQIVSRSLVFVAILAIGSVMVFIVVLDLLKYCFGIRPVDLETERDKSVKLINRPTFIVRFIYVNPSPFATND